VSAALLQSDVGSAKIATGSLNLSPAGFQVLGHPVERSHQISDLVGRPNLYPVIKSAA
jgi:hypothetical protein